MIPAAEWESLIQGAIAELAGGATAIALYGSSHPRATESVVKLESHLGLLLTTDSELSLVLLGEELFAGDRPFTRTSRHAPALIRRFRRRGVEHVTFLRGVEEGELRGFLLDLAAADNSPVHSRPHVRVGRVELAEQAEGGPDETASGKGRGRLPTVRDRVTLLQETFESFASGRDLVVGNLEAVARALVGLLGRAAPPMLLLAPWQGEERWPEVHAHNVCLLAQSLAMAGGVDAGGCVELGVGALVHDVGKLFWPHEARERELEMGGGDELELLLDHPREGLAALLSVAQVPALALVVTYEHHLNYNGTGYPRLPRPRRPHRATTLVSLADAYDILRTARFGRGLCDESDAMRWIASHAGARFDPALVDALRQVAGER
jgi:HD domain